jgi:hypothetical protein
MLCFGKRTSNPFVMLLSIEDGILYWKVGEIARKDNA